MEELQYGVIFNGIIIYNILSFNDYIKKGYQLDSEQTISMHDAKIVIKWIRNLKNEVEHHRLLDTVVVCLMNGLDKELASELKRSFEL